MLNSHWFLPYDEDSEGDKLAVRRALDFMLGWYIPNSTSFPTHAPRL